MVGTQQKIKGRKGAAGPMHVLLSCLDFTLYACKRGGNEREGIHAG